ncbi:TBC1 domain family member 15-like [Oopsacas minuta]|uniref:TBC1 domain family member 15-like n=1 Tax=Oopsacas minuta TaxID=111878 RepID=A0AAV7KB03_9METZ|nr:TBC1 domain family member 15-like [Oopsacas minuta]
MSAIVSYPVNVESDSITDHVQQFPTVPEREIILFSSENVFVHIPAQCSATNEEIAVRGILKLIHKDQIRVQWFPTNINTNDLTCLYSHDPSDDWEDILTDLNATDLPNGEANSAYTVGKSGIDSKANAHHSAGEITIPATNGDPNMTLRVKSETLLSGNKSPKSHNLSPGFVNIVTTPMYDDRKRGSSSGTPVKQPLIHFANNHNSPVTTPNNKSTNIFTIKQSPKHTENPLDNAIANLGVYSDLDADAVYLERDQAKIPEIRSVVVDFPLSMLFSVKEIPGKSNGESKSHPAIRFNLNGTKPTQILYFHSGKATMIKFLSELERHVLLHRHDEDPSLLMTEGEDFAGNYHKQRTTEHRSYMQMGFSKANDIISEIYKIPKLGAFMNSPFQKNPNTQFYAEKPEIKISGKSEEDNNLLEVTKSIPFLDKPNFDPLPLVQSIDGKKRGRPLNREDWEHFCNSDGSVSDPKALKRIIFIGGVSEDIRPLVWLYLLGYYEFTNTKDQREKLINQKENDYQVMRSQWKTMSSDQIKRNKSFHKAKTIIGKDTIRTDRDHPYFAGEENKNLDTLQDILLTHVMYDFDLGYVQGMSDILSPILIVVDREVNAFWCFAHYIGKLHENFANTTLVLNKKMDKFKDLLKFVDPPFCAYLRENEAYGFNIFFRWLLIDFKREFSLEDVLKLWEVLWTDHLTTDYYLFIALSMLLQMRHQIMEQDLDQPDFSPFDNIFKMINDAAGAFDVDKTLILAEALFAKLINCPNLPEEIIPLFPTYKRQKSTKYCPANVEDDTYCSETNLDVQELHFA